MRKSAPLILFCLIWNLSIAQSYKLHGVYIYAFTRYVIWPDTYSQGDFEILVMGESPIIEELKNLAAAKKLGDRNIKVTKINSPTEIKKCNILFIPANQSSHFNDVLTKLGNQSILLITEEPGLGIKGSDINFIMKDGKLAFELNQAAANKHNLKITTALTGMAILI